MTEISATAIEMFAFRVHLRQKLRTTNVIDAASWKYGAELDPWCALSMWPASTAFFTPSSRDSTWNGKIAPSSYLHRRLDITPPPRALDTPTPPRYYLSPSPSTNGFSRANFLNPRFVPKESCFDSVLPARVT